MLTVYVNKVRGFNEYSNKLFWLPEGVFKFENSLKAITKWEQKYKKPYLKRGYKKTTEEMIDYFYFMCLDENFDKRYLYLDQNLIEKLSAYVDDNPTATTIESDDNGHGTTLTSELIYAYMAIGGVPFSADEWNIVNLLMTLACISEINSAGTKPKKSESDLLAEYDEQNNRLRAEFGLD